MNPNSKQISPKIKLKSHSVKYATKEKPFRLLAAKNISTSTKKNIVLISNSIGEWNPFGEPEKCMICWKPLYIYDKDKNNYMECPHCHQKAHQDHMLRWLAQKKYCPYCQAKW